jgi:hypothetical protein
MDINSIGSNYGLDALNPTQATATQSASGVTTMDSTQLSPMASLLNQLQQLQQTDPDKFKSVMSTIADTLKADAQWPRTALVRERNQARLRNHHACRTMGMAVQGPPLSAAT